MKVDNAPKGLNSCTSIHAHGKKGKGQKDKCTQRFWELFLNKFSFTNHGAELVGTNFWESEHSRSGICYVTANAGTLRLLLPKSAEGMLVDMKKGKDVVIEPSVMLAGNVDIVFEDGTDTPFAISIDPEGQFDRPLENGNCSLTVWTQVGGKVLSFSCKVNL